MIYVVTLVILLLVVGVVGKTVHEFYLSGRVAIKRELDVTTKQLRIATGGLRKIANGISGAPELDAQNTLEDIENNTKEIA